MYECAISTSTSLKCPSIYQTDFKPALKRKYETKLKLDLKEKYDTILRTQMALKYKIDLARTLKKKYRNNQFFQNILKKKSILKYKTNSEHRLKVKNGNKKRKERKMKELENIKNVIAKFKKDTSEGPIYVCCVCNRLLFKNQVKICKEQIYAKKSKYAQKMAQKCITKTYLHDCNVDCLEDCSFSDNYKSLWICFTCHRKLLQGKMPADAVVNNMNPGSIPAPLSCLNQIEKHLISKNIVFLKLVKVSPFNDKKLMGETVCVPSNLTEMTNILPRCRNDDELIRVKLKKKLSHKGFYEYQTITKNHIKDALSYLKYNNKHYHDVILNKEWLQEQSDFNRLCSEKSSLERNSKDATNDSKLMDGDPCDSDDMDLVDENIGRYSCDLQTSCLQPVDISANIMNNPDKIFSISPSENNRPVRILMDKSNEACSFPYLFPQGNNTFAEDRDVRITLGKYLKNRLTSVDTRFASCSEYLFYSQYIYELQQILSGVSIALRKAKMGGNLITADMLTQDEPLQNILKADVGYAFMKNCRGSPAFWQATQKDLFAMIRQLGTPTFFVSFSCSELRFESFLSTILKQQGSKVSVDKLTWMEKRELLRSNPVTIARLFDQRFKLFVRNVLLSKANPIGKVSDYFFRSEIQARGAIHIHGIVYIAGAPKLDVDNDTSVVEFIDKYISCSLPDEQNDPELHEIVSNVQKHSSKHSKSCRKNKKICRFNFPKPPSNKTFICRPVEDLSKSKDSNIDSEIDKNRPDSKSENHMSNEQAKAILESIWKELSTPDRHHQTLSNLYDHLNITQSMYEKACEILTKKTYVVLKRSPNEAWINQYNPHLLRAWNANLDIQYVTDAHACVVYIVSYITKAEKEMGMLLRETYKEAKQNNLDAKSCMRKISSAYLHSREVSGPESTLRVLGLPLKQFSRKVQFIPTGKNNIRMTLPLKVLQSRAKDGTLNDQNMFMISIVDRYIARPKSIPFHDMCIASFNSEYRLLSKSEKPNVDSEKNPAFELQNDLGYIIKRSRTSPAIVRYARFSETKDPENYYLSSLQLFLPYRSDSQLKPPPFDTYEEFYKSGHIKLSGKIVQVRQVVEQNRRRFQTDIDIDSISDILERCGDFEDAWANIAPETEQNRIETETFRAENDVNEEYDDNTPQIPDILCDNSQSSRVRTETSISTISKSEAMPLLRSLNEIQSQVFYEVRQYCLDKVNGKNPDPLRLFVTGSAGTGKSHLIKCIQYEASRILAKTAESLDDITVLLTAPTGVSAFNIGASTIHSSFSIRKGFSFPPYQPLGQETINTLRCKYRNLQILIVDEISMVDHKLFCYIHGRLNQIKGTNEELFGNICVICFGDMWQLRPVKGNSLCHENVIDLWKDNFKLVELTEIMRQKDDLTFAQALNRIRQRKKSEPMLGSDIKMFESRVTGKEDDCLHIFSTNQQVDDYNSRMIDEKCPNSVSITALDYSKDARTGKMSLKNTCVKVTDTPLVSNLKIGVGSKVMLVINLNVAAGLINGSFGTVTFIHTDQNNQINQIFVKFDNAKVGKYKETAPLPPNVPHGSIAIERYESPHVNYKGDIRRQFPLRLAYAVTIHKVQGLSIDKGVISLDKIFQAGQAYVALSRVKTLKGLTIQGFAEKNIYCDEKIESALRAMNKFLQPEKETSPTDTNIILHNVQGLSVNIKDLQKHRKILRGNIICLTETWLDTSITPAKLKLNGFRFHHQPRSSSYDTSKDLEFLKEKGHGGVGVYYKESQNCSILKLGVLNIEHIALYIQDKNINVIVIYRPPDYRLNLFLPMLQRLLVELEESGSDYIIMGDFNQNILEGHLSIVNCFKTYGFRQLVQQYTTEGGTLIDHVYISKDIPSQNVKISNVPVYYSYHEAIQITIR